MKTTQDIIVLLAQTEVLVPLKVLWKFCGMCPSFVVCAQPKKKKKSTDWQKIHVPHYEKSP